MSPVSLKQAVNLSKEDTDLQLTTVASFFSEIKDIPANLRTDQEKELFKLVKAADSSLPLVNIATAISVGKKNRGHFPTLAVASYDMSFRRAKTFAKVYQNGAVVFEEHPKGWKMTFSAGTLAKVQLDWMDDRKFPILASSPVPLVPPLLRQSKTKDLVILFEAQWKDMTAKRDPYLLKKVAGNVYSVLGSWDITDKELKAYQLARDLGVK